MLTGDKVKIVTHNAGFHTDDVFAVATLSLIFDKESKSYEVTRSRDKDIINSGDYVVDVGGIHDESINRFDHHQEGGAGKRENGIPYASFGLVWKKFGEEICGSKEVANKVDQLIVQPIDALDNGISIVEQKIEGIRPFDIGLITASFYPTWKEDALSMDNTFLELVKYAKFFIKIFVKCKKDDFESEKIVLDIYNNSEDKRLIVVENSLYRWNDVLSTFPEPLFAIYQNANNNTWSIKGVRNNSYTFIYRKFLPESWAGKRDEELEKITGVSGAVFCHNARFMAVAKTKEGALKLAEIALNS